MKKTILLMLVLTFALASVNLAAEDTWTYKADMPTARGFTSGCVVDGKIYVIGGFPSHYSVTTANEMYDPATDTWTRMANMPSARCGHATCTYNGKIYVFGGTSPDGYSSAKKNVYVYDPQTDSWTLKADMPYANAFCGIAVVNDTIYLIGGTTKLFSPPISTVMAYDPVIESWIPKADMLTARASLSACVVDGKIYTFGGADQNLLTYAYESVEVYDPATNTWTTKTDMPTSRFGLGTCAMNGKIYAVGGVTNGLVVVTANELYDPVTDTWATKSPMQVKRQTHFLGSVGNKIYAIGGSYPDSQGEPVMPSSVEEYDTGLGVPSPDFNGDGIVDSADMCIMIDHWGEDYPPCDIAPPPFGDGIVDVEDLIVLAEHLFEVYPSAEAGESESKWVLTWSDEFDVESIDLTKWTHMIGDGTNYGEQPGWGNNEKQFYTDDPANSGIIIDDEGNSVLFIEAIMTNVGESEYTSAKLTTEDLFTFRFGKVEARIKLPYSQGIWPAFWMLGSNKPQIGWPGCGEIDIMEMLGGAEETVYGNIHYVNSDHEHDEDLGFRIIEEGKYCDDYHIYSIEWSPGNIKWLVDGEYFHEIEITADMKEFLRSHFLILNIAVGGYWPGYPDETSVFPQRMYVDYIRIYQDTNLIDIPAEPVLDVEEETMGLGSTSALAAINSDFTPFHDIKIVKYGPASPDISVSTVAIDGQTSILAVYSGGNWGGFWFELDSPIDMREYHNGNLIVMLDVPENIADFEVKLESTGGFGSVNLLDYPSEPVDNNYDKFTIPLADFVALGLKLESLTIPFALWNPKGIGGEYTGGNVLVDNIYFDLSD